MSVAKRIIPCLDVDKGRVVKGINFVDIVDAGDPVEVAKKYDSEGADEITFLDITASHEGRDTILSVVEKVANEVFIPLTVGGGVSDFNDVRDLLSVGADKVTINTAAVSNPNIINDVTEKIGRQCIVIAVDVKKIDNEYYVFTHGGRKNSMLSAYDWCMECQKRGAGEILLTSMDKDGTKDGFDLEILNTISTDLNIPLIASGGAGNLEHLHEAITKGNADAVLAASIFHFGEFSITEAKEYLKGKGILVR
ncbi:MAG: imidazole glycerol phosphate synthase subunit HisF [Gammaproteobacteria bacterium]|nr:imidazole glycerol phosphate synthase subunit HisF [Gammaproteobacteria bacterium]MBL6819288.1 imidazole glycerol phosphate synthase subunit HisF [Gammaproteobacteria bacterium]MBL6898467.1 imidazole glycerol phosphate synthase subunit HisF [Gammaproteobacteria bacterium]